MNEERHGFYVGVKRCGCITATLVDDSITKPKEIADFAREMEKTGRRIRTGIASSRSPSMSTDFQNPRASARGADADMTAPREPTRKQWKRRDLI